MLAEVLARPTSSGAPSANLEDPFLTARSVGGLLLNCSDGMHFADFEGNSALAHLCD